MSSSAKVLVGVVGLAALGLGGRWWLGRGRESGLPPLRTAKLARGELLVTIAATGTVEPEDVVDVGAQVAGIVLGFGKDAQGAEIDYGSEVEENTVLARIDDSLYTADVALVTAQLAQAQAGARAAEADLGQLRAKLVQAERDWERAKKIGPSEALAQTSYDAYEAAWEIAKANVGVGEATLVQTRASVDQAQAALDRSKRNLAYCTIRSPVKGVIIDRRVNIGQTVVSSLNAPSLFLIAKDLKRMQVWVSVNEADIGNIRAGQPVAFTVDAFPGESFRGEVGKVRLNATMTQNVVTYTVEVLTDNSSGKLLPYLTANVRFEVSRKADALLVPNAALRWTPQPERIAIVAIPATDLREQGAPAKDKSRGADSPRGASPTRGTVWVLAGDLVRAVRVKVGGTDGTSTEIEGDGLSEGVEVAIGEEVPDATAAPATTTTNPFTPQMPPRSGRRGG